MQKDFYRITVIAIFLVVGAAGAVISIINGMELLDIIEKMGTYMGGCAAIYAVMQAPSWIKDYKHRKVLDSALEIDEWVEKLVNETNQKHEIIKRFNPSLILKIQKLGNIDNIRTNKSLEILNQIKKCFRHIVILGGNSKFENHIEALSLCLLRVNFGIDMIILYPVDDEYIDEINQNYDEMRVAIGEAKRLTNEIKDMILKILKL